MMRRVFSVASRIWGSLTTARQRLTVQVNRVSTVHLYQNGARIADIIVGNSGVWSYAYTTASPLADDTYTFTVTASDSNGNTTPFSTDFTITIDTQAPAAPGVIGVADGDGNTIDTNQITQESQPPVER
ncbi:large repetitive protein [Salmonella enterica subsp. enterica]|uniref:Large repetitive protein n=1 Tax=Salmonella enterica I TaxID=59201 RepID=A0A3S4HTA7_SALET|nr:large repetitive protein [Salmonella enterica subsp. enterica]